MIVNLSIKISRELNILENNIFLLNCNNPDHLKTNNININLVALL